MGENPNLRETYPKDKNPPRLEKINALRCKKVSKGVAPE
jgi:hypothetical protein